MTPTTLRGVPMRTHTQLPALLTALALGAMLSPTTVAAEEPTMHEEGYFEVEIPLPTDTDPSTVVLFGSGQLITMNGGMFNGFIPKGYVDGNTNVVVFDRATPSGVPSNAVVSKVEVTSTKTNVQGMTHYVLIGKGNAANNITSVDGPLQWASTVTSTFFNGQHPAGYWALQFYATRIILPPDNGAGITINSATMKVYWQN
jgi:hypothetical protein